MTKLLIIVPKDSALDSYLANSLYIFDEIAHSSQKSFYKMYLNDKLVLINFLISEFSLQDYSIRCHYDEFVFRVLS